MYENVQLNSKRPVLGLKWRMPLSRWFALTRFSEANSAKLQHSFQYQLQLPCYNAFYRQKVPENLEYDSQFTIHVLGTLIQLHVQWCEKCVQNNIKYSVLSFLDNVTSLHQFFLNVLISLPFKTSHIRHFCQLTTINAFYP
ncbi:Hypothetical_protein [Hexamita inflata]|uniref:Hypothetical_protein n=1 Tax=Hexamita inflata TaxID=28002 RepID=A0AA86VM81_9EUKA|nr:Hypothetical protein HINF_LOCUS58308 [Hexamita inflata]